MQIELLTKGDLDDLKDKIICEIKEFLKIKETSSDWLKSSEVKEIMNCSDGTLQKIRNSGKLPFKKINGTIYYKKGDVDNLFSNFFN